MTSDNDGDHAEFMDVDDVARRLKVTKATVYEIISLGKLRCFRIGARRGTIRVSEQQLREFLGQNETGEKRPAPRPVPVKLKHLS